MLPEEKIEELINEYRPPDEILEEDRVSGPFVEGEEFIVGVGDAVYRAPLVLPWHQAWQFMTIKTTDDQVKAVAMVFGLFKPQGMETAFQHPANAQFVLGAWANVSGAIFNQRTHMAVADTKDDDTIGREYYNAVRKGAGIIGHVMADWDSLPDRTKQSYIDGAKRRNGGTQ